MAYVKKIQDDITCPLEYAMDLFGGKWKSRIICVLNAKPGMRYSELRREMCNITDPVLSAALKELQQDGMISRKSFDEIPPHVEYSLTGMGRSLAPLLQDICKWAGSYHQDVTNQAMKICQHCNYRGAKAE